MDRIDIIIADLLKSKKQISCIDSLSHFTLFISKFIQEETVEEIALLICIITKFLDDHGWDCFDKLGTVYDRMDGLYSENMSMEYFPDYANIFLLDYMPKVSEQLLSDNDNEQLEEYKFIGDDQIHLLRLTMLIRFFCSWLSENKLTIAKIDIIRRRTSN